MKVNTLFLGFLSLLLLTTSCDDDLSTIGSDTMPDRDKVEIHSDTIYLGEYTTTVDAGPVMINPIVTGFAIDSESLTRSSSFLLGSFYDLIYGSFSADFTTMFAPNPSLFESNIVAIDTVLLRLTYHSWIGDSVAPMVAKVYPSKRIPNTPDRFFSNIDLPGHAVSDLWSVRPYTARDMSLTDSLHTAMGYNEVSFDITNCTMPGLGTNVATAFLDEWKSNPITFDSISLMEAFFPGVYVTTEGRNGSLLKIFDVSMVFKYRFTYEGKDSITTTSLSSRNDVKQAYRYVEENQLPIGQTNPEVSYIKSPAGVFTQYAIPIKKIMETVGNREINAVRLSLSAFPGEDRRYALSAPATLMLIRKDSLENFFDENRNVSAPNSYKASYSSFAYNYGDISGMIREGIKDYQNNPNDPQKESIEVILVPIVEQNRYSNSGYLTGTRTAYDIVPSAVRLRTGKDHLRLEILSSEIYKE